ncbi:MAG: serine/threonine-protein kinase [Acidimicrobiales bacterium]
MSVGRPASDNQQEHVAPILDIDGLSDFRRIGTGGFATVYSALEANAGRRVAVKVLTAVDDSGRRRFDRECLTMGAAGEHQHVVTLLRADYLRTTGQPYLVMEHMAGGSLAHRLTAEGAIPWLEAIEAILAIASALGFTHGRGILHKDVKPGNILISAAGAVKLTDFGIAAIREASGTSQLAYSIHFTAPEIFGGTADPAADVIIDPRDERSDLYSLAASLYTLGMGRPPFLGSTHVALMRQILEDPVPPTGSAGLDAFFARALAKDPAERPPSAADLAAELAHLRDAFALTGSTTGRWPAGPPTPPASRATDPRTAAPGGFDHPTDIDPRNGAISRTGSDAGAVGAAAVGDVVSSTLVALPPAPAPVDAPDDPPPAAPEAGAVSPGRRRWLLAGTAAVIAIGGGTGVAAALRSAGTDVKPPPAAPIIYAGHRQFAADRNDDAVFATAEVGDGRLASVSADGTLLVWDPADPAATLSWTGYRDELDDPGNDTLYAVAHLADGRLAVGGADGTVRLWDPARPDARPAQFTGHRDRVDDPSNDDVYAIIELADGRVASAGDDGTVQIWDPGRPGAPAASYTRHRDDADSGDGDAVWSLAELPDGRIASGSADGTVDLWLPGRPQSTATVYTGHFDAAGDPSDDVVRAIVALADGRIASGGADGTIRIWDPAQPGATMATFDAHTRAASGRDADTVRAMIQLPDGRIASGDMSGTIFVWDPALPGATPGRYSGHSGQINGLELLADGRVASSSDDGTVQIWDPASIVATP